MAILYTVCSNSDVILKTAPTSGWIEYSSNIGGNASGSTGGNTDVNTGGNTHGNHIFNTGSNTLLAKVISQDSTHCNNGLDSNSNNNVNIVGIN